MTITLLSDQDAGVENKARVWELPLQVFTAPGTQEIKTEKKNKYTELVTKLDSISPLKTLIRGYSLTEKDGKIIKRATQIDKGDIITIKFSDGEKNAEIL